MGVVLFNTNETNNAAQVNKLKVQEMLTTSSENVEPGYVSLQYADAELEADQYITNLVFNTEFSQYLNEFKDVAGSNSFVVKITNLTKETTLLGTVTNISNAEVKITIATNDEKSFTTQEIDVDDELIVELDFARKENIQTVSTHADIPLESGTYLIDVFNFYNTDIYKFSDNSVVQELITTCYVKRDKLGENEYIDKIYSENKLLGYINVKLEFNSIVRTELNTYNSYLPDNCYTKKNKSNYAYLGKISKTLTEDDLEVEGLIKIPYDLKITLLKSNLMINESSVSHEIVYVSDSVNETVTPYLRLLNAPIESNSLLLNKKLNFEFDFEYNSLLTYEPVIKNFIANGDGLIINDYNLSHSNRIKNWVQEYINNNLTGTPPTIIGYENLDVSTKVGQDTYRLDVMYRNNSDLACSATSVSYNSFKKNDQDKNIFKIIALGSNLSIRLNRTTAEDDFLEDVVMVTSREETDNDGTDPEGTSYGFGVEFNEPTRIADLTAISLTPDIDTHQQTPATAIVTAKFKWLRNETGAPWGLIREACRATASNAGSYNIYRGFGKIDTAAAKTYIETNINTWTGVNTTELAEYYDAISPYNTDVPFSEKTDKTPAIKKDLVEELSTLNDNLQSLINGKVSKSGDTITGLLTVEDELIVNKRLRTNQNRFSSIAIENYSQNNAWAIRSNSNLANYSGLFFLNHNSQYGLRDETGTLRAEIKSVGTSYLNGGNFAIGQTSASEKLDINGKAKAHSILLKSPDGNYHEVTVDNSGNLVVL